MSAGDSGPSEARDDPGRAVTQRAMATRGGRVNQAGGHMIIFNAGNALWLAGPGVVVAAVMLVLYLTAGPVHPSGSPSPRAVAPLASGPPLTVALAYDRNGVDNGRGGACEFWTLNRPLSTVPAPPNGTIDETWVHRFGGVDADTTDFKLVVQGTTPTAVQLLGFRVVDVKRGSASSGTSISNSDGCGPNPEAGFGIALAHHPPLITPIPGLGGVAKKSPFPFVVSSTDIQQFQIEAHGPYGPDPNPCDCDIKWRLALDWSYRGKLGTTIIDDHGQPFQTSFPAFTSSGLTWFDSAGIWKHL